MTIDLAGRMSSSSRRVQNAPQPPGAKLTHVTSLKHGDSHVDAALGPNAEVESASFARSAHHTTIYNDISTDDVMLAPQLHLK